MININKSSRKIVEDHESPSTNHKLLFSSQSNSQFLNHPCKSPSPDKKRANIITPTKSPEVIEIKRNMTPLRLSQRRFQKTPIQVSSKNTYEQSTKYYTNEDFQEYRSSQHKKNEVVEELEEMLPQQFVLNNTNESRLRMSQYRSGHQSKKELDYIRLLQQKEKTIKELHEIIQMINRNNSLDLSLSQLSAPKNKSSLQRSDKFLSSLQSPSDKQEKQVLRQQIKTLTIENQQLVHMIDKIHQREFKSSINPLIESKYSTGDPIKYSNIDPQRYSNIDPHRYSSVDPNRQQKEQYNQRAKEENLIRELIALKQSLTNKQTQCLQLSYQNKQLLSKYTQLDLQNQKLIKMMKDKQLSDRKYHASLIESTLSAQKSPQSSQIITNHNTLSSFTNTKEKLSLIKIKEQYNESLKVFKDTVCGDVQEFMTQMGRSFNRLEHKVIELQEQILMLERFKSAHESMKFKQKHSELIPLSIEHKEGTQQEQQEPKQLRESFSKINELEELSQIQLRSPQRGNNNREIESLLLKGERDRGAERQQQELREGKIKCQDLLQKCKLLEKEKRQLQQRCQILRSKCLQLQQEGGSQSGNLERKYREREEVKVRLRQSNRKPSQMGDTELRRSQMGENKMRRNQEIEDINLGRAQQLQIKSLREMIRKYQQQSEDEKQLMKEQIQILKSKNMQYQTEIHSIRQESTLSKQFPLSQKQEIKKQLQQTGKQLFQAKQQLSSTRQQLLQAKYQLQQLTSQLQKARSQMEQQRARLQQREQYIDELKELILSKEQNQSHTHQQIQKLISNYSQEINILKQTLSNEQLNHQHQITKYQHQKRIHQQQKYVLQQQNLVNETKYEQEIIKNQQDKIVHQQHIAKYQQHIAKYQQHIAKYEEDIAKYEEDIAKYQQQKSRYQQERLKYEYQIEQLNTQIRRLVNQGENVQRLMSDSESRNKLQLQKANQQVKSRTQRITEMQQQIKSMQQQIKLMQQQMKPMQQQIESMHCQLELKNQQLQAKKKAQYKWKEEEQLLIKDHKEMKQTIDRLLLVANEIQEMEVEKDKLANEGVHLRQVLAQEKQRSNNLNKQNNQLAQQNSVLVQKSSGLAQKNNLLEQERNLLTQHINRKQIEVERNEKRIQSMAKRVVQLEQLLNRKDEQIDTLRIELEMEVKNLTKQLNEQHELTDRLRKQLMEQQSQCIRTRRQSEQQISAEKHRISQQQSLHKTQIVQYESQLSSLNNHIQQLTRQLQTLSYQCQQNKQQLASLSQDYDELLEQQQHPLEELYHLRTLLTTKSSSLESQADKQIVAKLLIDYQFKCDQLLSLNSQLEQIKEQLIHTQSQKYLLEEKCLSLQKNIALYQTELKQRKLLTENLINDKTKLEKQLALAKKTQLQTHQHQSQSLKLNLTNLINKAITIEEKRNLQLKQKALQFQQRPYQSQSFQQRPYQTQQKPHRMRAQEQQLQQETEGKSIGNNPLHKQI